MELSTLASPTTGDVSQATGPAVINTNQGNVKPNGDTAGSVVNGHGSSMSKMAEITGDRLGTTDMGHNPLELGKVIA